MDTRRAVAFIPASPADEHETDALPRTAGLDVVATVLGDEGAGEMALADALERIARGEASVLLAARLGDVAGSARELLTLLEWLADAGADLVARDVGLDTGSPCGRRTVATLREVEGWGAAPTHGRPPRGRPGVRTRAPELGARIASMREDGLSLRAIAEALNAEGVPTPRGGLRWRASSVQAALGYRRPRPPLPGAPPPRPTGKRPHDLGAVPRDPGPGSPHAQRKPPRPPHRAGGRG
jgi:DNA invertase Pin-like site-specific DNA recombinase